MLEGVVGTGSTQALAQADPVAGSVMAGSVADSVQTSSIAAASLSSVKSQTDWEIVS